MELILLGTGNAMVTKCYNTCFAFRSGAAHYLVDAGGGNGILRQLELAEIPAESIEGMFITHGHTDHILGAVWIVRKMAELMKKGAYTGEFVIRCHDEAAQMLTTFCEMTLAPAQLRYVGNGIRIQSVAAGEEFDALGMRIRVFDIFPPRRSNLAFPRCCPMASSSPAWGTNPITRRPMRAPKGATGCFPRRSACMRTGNVFIHTKNIIPLRSMRGAWRNRSA